jgi:hypothetical protein
MPEKERDPFFSPSPMLLSGRILPSPFPPIEKRLHRLFESFLPGGNPSLRLQYPVMDFAGDMKDLIGEPVADS